MQARALRPLSASALRVTEVSSTRHLLTMRHARLPTTCAIEFASRPTEVGRTRARFTPHSKPDSRRTADRADAGRPPRRAKPAVLLRAYRSWRAPGPRRSTFLPTIPEPNRLPESEPSVRSCSPGKPGHPTDRGQERVFGLRVHRVRATDRRVSTSTVRVLFGPPQVQTFWPRKRALKSASCPASRQQAAALHAVCGLAVQGARRQVSKPRSLVESPKVLFRRLRCRHPFPSQLNHVDPGRNQRPTANLTSRLGTYTAVFDRPKAWSSPSTRRDQLSRASLDRS
jgi:hypothetical protein